jgi:hypothetical protein
MADSWEQAGLEHRRTVPLPLTIHAGAHNNPYGVWAPGLGGLILMSIAFRLGWRGVALRAAAVGIALLVIIVLLLRQHFLRHAALFVDEEQAGLIRAFGTRKVFHRSEIAKIALRTVVAGRSPIKKLILVGQDGTALLSINSLWYSYADAALFAAALRVPVDQSWDVKTTAARLNAEFPGSETWIAQHAMPLMIGIALGLIGVVVWTTAHGPAQ